MGIAGMRQSVATVLAGGTSVPPDLGPPTAQDGEADAIISRLATLTPQQVRVLMIAGGGAPQQADRL